uniref:Uncharacterized protein n=1 Tax=Glossina austeni TaxID=7395 RepID=A0A1A9UDN6_GLOAU
MNNPNTAERGNTYGDVQGKTDNVTKDTKSLYAEYKVLKQFKEFDYLVATPIVDMFRAFKMSFDEKLTSGRQKFETYCKTDKVPIEANTPPPYLSTKPQRTKIKQQRRAPTHLNMQAKYCVLQVNGNHPVAKNFANK